MILVYSTTIVVQLEKYTLHIVNKFKKCVIRILKLNNHIQRYFILETFKREKNISKICHC